MYVHPTRETVRRRHCDATNAVFPKVECDFKGDADGRRAGTFIFFLSHLECIVNIRQFSGGKLYIDHRSDDLNNLSYAHGSLLLQRVELGQHFGSNSVSTYSFKHGKFTTDLLTTQHVGPSFSAPSWSAEGRQGHADGYLAPYPIFCLKVTIISFNLSATLSSIFPMLAISFFSSGWCCCT